MAQLSPIEFIDSCNTALWKTFCVSDLERCIRYFVGAGSQFLITRSFSLPNMPEYSRRRNWSQQYITQHIFTVIICRKHIFLTPISSVCINMNRNKRVNDAAGNNENGACQLRCRLSICLNWTITNFLLHLHFSWGGGGCLTKRKMNGHSWLFQSFVFGQQVNGADIWDFEGDILWSEF